MKAEHEDILNQIRKDTFGEITFTRYDLATALKEDQQIDFILKEALQFLFLCHQSNLETLYASHESTQKIYLITLQFQNQSLCNLFIDGAAKNEQVYKKQIEIVGTKGLYQYNSSYDRGLTSNFILPGNYIPDYQEGRLDDIWLSRFVQQIYQAIATKTVVDLRGSDI